MTGREALTWKQRRRDFDNWGRPQAAFEPPSIMAPGALKEKELQESAAEEAKKWAAAMVVEDAHFHCHRQLPATEAAAKGAKVKKCSFHTIQYACQAAAKGP